MGTIEKHVLSASSTSSLLFQKWFSMLVMDEGLTARVTTSFPVIVEQNGFETEYSFMSGGEEECSGPAYRLALNRVINDLIEKIKNKRKVSKSSTSHGRLFSTGPDEFRKGRPERS